MFAGALDLGEVAGIYLLIGLLVIVSFTFARLAQVLDVGIFGLHPFSGIASGIENTIVAGCNAGIHGLEHRAVALESGLIDTFGIIIGVPLVLAIALKDGLVYMWDHALMPRVHAVTDDIRDVANAAHALGSLAWEGLSELEDGLPDRIATVVGSLLGPIYDYVHQETGRLESSFTAHINTLSDTVDTDIRAAIATAENSGTAALNALRTAEQAAVQAATAEADVALGELGQLIDGTDIPTIALLIASIPALKLLVQTIATESGLENADCRSKVKGICGTNPASWGNLLADLAPLAIGLSLRDLVVPAREAVSALTTVIEDVAA